MSKDKMILTILWFIGIVLFIKGIPKTKIRHGLLAFLFKQLITWLFGILVVEKGLIKYPVRLFAKANKTSFSFEYFFYPTVCALFNVHFPESRNRFIKFLYYFVHAGSITSFEFILERYTNLIEYVKWKWYWSFITIVLTLYSSRKFYRWFFKEEFDSEVHYIKKM